MSSTSDLTWVLGSQSSVHLHGRNYQSLEVTEVEFSSFSPPKYCYGLAEDSDGNLFATYGQAIMKYTPSTKTTEIWAGLIESDSQQVGLRQDARFSTPLGLYWHKGWLYVVQMHGIQRLAGDLVERYTGHKDAGSQDGALLVARFNNPTHMAAVQDTFYVTDSFNHKIRKITSDGQVSTLTSQIAKQGDLSTNGDFTLATFRYPRGICLGPNEKLLVVESSNSPIREIDLDRGVVAPFNYDRTKPYHFALNVCYSHSGETLVCDTSGEIICIIDRDGCEKHLIAKAGDRLLDSNFSVARPTATCITEDGDLYWTCERGSISHITAMFPPRRPQSFDFSLGLEFSSSAIENPADLASFVESPSVHDLILHHQASGRAVALSSQLAKILEISSPKGLETCKAPFETCESFLRFLYGSIPSLPTDIPLLQLSHYALIAEDMGVSQGFRQILLSALASRLPPLAMTELSYLIIDSTNSPTEYPELMSVFAAEMAKRAEGPDDPLSDLMVALSLDGVAPKTILATTVSAVHPSPAHWLQEKLGRFTSTIELVQGENEVESEFPTNFTFEIESPDGMCTIGVHDWVVSPRWTFFQKMLNAGLDEAKQRRARLPSNFTPSLAISLIRYIYCGLVDHVTLTDADCQYLILNGPAYSITDFADFPQPGFESLVNHCKSRSKSVPEGTD